MIFFRHGNAELFVFTLQVRQHRLFLPQLLLQAIHIPLLAADRLLPADLTGAVLRGADLTGADLRRAVMVDADLSRATLHGAQTKQADFTGAQTSGARGLDPADLHAA